MKMNKPIYLATFTVVVSKRVFRITMLSRHHICKEFFLKGFSKDEMIKAKMPQIEKMINLTDKEFIEKVINVTLLEHHGFGV